MGRPRKLIGAPLGLFLLMGFAASGQELKAVGQIRSSGPTTGEATEKIVSRPTPLTAQVASEYGPTYEFSFGIGLRNDVTINTPL